MKYDPKQIKKEFKNVLSKRDIKNSQDINRIIYNFIAEKVFKEINSEDYKEVSDLVWRVFIDTVNFVLHYGIIFRKVLAEFRKEFKEDLKKELKLNEEYKDLINEVLRLRRYKEKDFEVQETDNDLDA